MVLTILSEVLQGAGNGEMGVKHPKQKPQIFFHFLQTSGLKATWGTPVKIRALREILRTGSRRFYISCTPCEELIPLNHKVGLFRSTTAVHQSGGKDHDNG